MILFGHVNFGCIFSVLDYQTKRIENIGIVLTMGIMGFIQCYLLNYRKMEGKYYSFFLMSFYNFQISFLFFNSNNT